eukprot:TRINITY_DN9626_c0_g1_i6.p1 TRINITY_DN9626_c0_g1~~TRINITY_DN9626_c0_g1_i6.p1  ORF type:complete len:121 (+),score=18.71 TRINITY_DN9626_c0_g1_i6:453-815(+)
MLVSGPFFHYWYKLLGYLAENFVEPRKIIFQISLDRLVATPIYFLFFFTWNTITSKPFPEWSKIIYQDADTKLATIVARSLFLWVPAQYINFTVVPPQFRVLFGNLVSLLWNIYFTFVNQ